MNVFRWSFPCSTGQYDRFAKVELSAASRTALCIEFVQFYQINDGFVLIHYDFSSLKGIRMLQIDLDFIDLKFNLMVSAAGVKRAVWLAGLPVAPVRPLKRGSYLCSFLNRQRANGLTPTVSIDTSGPLYCDPLNLSRSDGCGLFWKQNRYRVSGQEIRQPLTMPFLDWQWGRLGDL